MKTLSKFIAYVICLQLTVGSYPIQNHMAYAEETVVTPTENNSDWDQSGGNRGPASEDLSISADEWFANFRNQLDIFDKYCVGKKGIASDVAVMDANEIGGSGKITNCDALAEALQKELPVAEDIYQEKLHAKGGHDCADCNINAQATGLSVQQVEDRKAENENTCKKPNPVATLEQQATFAKEDCSMGCQVTNAVAATVSVGVVGGLLKVPGCPADARVSGQCVAGLAKGIWEGIKQILFFIPELIWDGLKWTAKKIFGKAETATSEKAHALAGLSDAELKAIYPNGQYNKEAAETTFMQKVANFFKEFGQAVIGYPEYAEQAKCVGCSGKADLVCGMIGNTGGFLLTLFGNGLIFGAAKGLGSNIASKLMRFSKGVVKFSEGESALAKTTAKVLKTGKKVGTGIADATVATGKFIKGTWVAKPFIAAGELLVKGGSKLSEGAGKFWERFKTGKTYAALSKYKAIVTSDAAEFKATKAALKNAKPIASIPKRIALNLGRGVSKSFQSMGAFEDRMYMKGVGLTNKGLQKTMLRAQNINKLRAARINELQKDGNTTAATDEALKNVNTLVVAKDIGDARSKEEWLDIKKKVVSNNTKNLKVSHLEDSENAIERKWDFGNDKKSILVDTPKQVKEVRIANPGDVESIHTYGEGDRYAIVKNKDGSYVIHDMDTHAHIAEIPKEKSQYVDALMGKETPEYQALSGKAYEDVKTNLKLNGTKYTETIDAEGNKALQIETPNGCNPKVVNFTSGGFAI